MVNDWLGAFSLCDARHRRELHDELMLRVDYMCVPYLHASNMQVHLSVDPLGSVRSPSLQSSTWWFGGGVVSFSYCLMATVALIDLL